MSSPSLSRTSAAAKSRLHSPTPLPLSLPLLPFSFSSTCSPSLTFGFGFGLAFTFDVLRWFEFNLLFCLNNCLLFVQSSFSSPLSYSVSLSFNISWLGCCLSAKVSQQCRRRQFLLPNFLHLFCANLISCVISFLCSQLTAALAALKLRRVTPPQLLLLFTAHFWHSAVVCLEANFVNNSAHNIENLLLLRKKGHTE